MEPATRPAAAGPAPEPSFAALIWALYRAMSPRRRRHVLLTLGLMFVAAVAEFVTIGTVLPFLALLVDPGHAADLPGFGLLVALAGGEANLLPAASLCLVVASIAAGVARLAVLHTTHRLAFTLGHELGAEIFSRTLRQPYSVHVGRNPSEVFAGVEKVQSLIYSLLLPLMQGLVAAAIALAIVSILAAVAPLVTAAAAGTVAIIYIALSLATGRRLRSNSLIISRTANARTKALQEGLGALREILLGQAQGVFEAKFNALDRTFRATQADSLFISAAPRAVLETAGTVLIGLLALYMSGQPGGLIAAIPLLGALALGSQRLLPLINTVYVGWSMFAGNIRMLSDVLDLIEAPGGKRPDGRPEPLPFEREIVFDKVSLDYPGRGYALRDISLVIERGARIGLAGPTGSGKSSLLDLMMGLLDPSAGTITIDSRALDDSTRAGWQCEIAHVPQSVYLADASIAANIAFGYPDDQIDPERVREAARRAQLETFIAGLPDGSDTLVGDRGVRLSGGQRQRIAIARALYKKARLLILDEPTGQLDPETEQAIVATIAAIDRDVTILVVAHHPAALAGCDRIVRLQQGRIAAPLPARAARKQA